MTLWKCPKNHYWCSQSKDRMYRRACPVCGSAFVETDMADIEKNVMPNEAF